MFVTELQDHTVVFAPRPCVPENNEYEQKIQLLTVHPVSASPESGSVYIISHTISERKYVFVIFAMTRS